MLGGIGKEDKALLTAAKFRVICALLLIWGSFAAHADVDLPSKFSNQGSVANTRHNMTQRQPGGGGPNGVVMDPYRADYGEVCVYCHTPHGASTAYALPLWNRTIVSTTYQTYTTLGSATMTQPVSQPGLNSLSCLSCHDGQVAIDSIINMPGSGRYLAAQQTTQNTAFLNTWSNPNGPGPFAHMNLNPAGCLACHSSTAGFVGAGAPDYTVFAISTDLRDDHPVGVRYPAAGPGIDFQTPTATYRNVRYFDTNGNGRPDKNEIRLFDTGQGHEVECASCHDPHGVPSGGPGSQFNRSFLRVSNAGSGLCLRCHVK